MWGFSLSRTTAQPTATSAMTTALRQVPTKGPACRSPAPSYPLNVPSRRVPVPTCPSVAPWCPQSTHKVPPSCTPFNHRYGSGVICPSPAPPPPPAYVHDDALRCRVVHGQSRVGRQRQPPRRRHRLPRPPVGTLQGGDSEGAPPARTGQGVVLEAPDSRNSLDRRDAKGLRSGAALTVPLPVTHGYGLCGLTSMRRGAATQHNICTLSHPA